MGPTPGLRRTSRILVVDPSGAALLFLTAAPDSSRFTRWITPGGGVDPGESYGEAAVRELFEETGLVVDDLGESIHSFEFAVAWDEADHDRGHAEYYALAVEKRFEPSNANWTDDERVDVTAHRWATADELESGSEPFEPTHLPELIRRAAGRA